MRIYKSDGTYVDNPKDTGFGWNIDNFEEQETSIDEGNVSEPSAVLINRINPQIIIQYPQSVIDNQLRPEGLNLTDHETKKIENIDSTIPPKYQVANLINPCSVESKMLLAVIHYAKYKNLNKDVINLGDLRNSSKIKFLINNERKNIQDEIRNEIKNYHENKEDNMLSLMMELILNDNGCDMSDISEFNHNVESSDLGNSIRTSDSDDDSNHVPRLEVENRQELLSSIGFSEVIDRSIGQMCEETHDIHLKIEEIKKSFQDEELRINNLIEEAQILKKSLREVTFLDDLIHLLNGDLDKVTKRKCPFRLFLDSANQDEPNLIV